IIILLTINLTLTPALLLLFGNWIETPPQEKIEQTQSEQSLHLSGNWYRIGKFATKNNFSIIFVILILTLPLAFQFLNTTPKAQIEFFASSETNAGKGFLLLDKSFGAGTINPIQLVVVPDNNDIWTTETFLAIQSFINKTIQQTILQAEEFSSHAWLDGNPIPFEYALGLTTPASPVYNTIEGQLYRQVVQEFIGLKQEATIVTIIFPVDPFSPEAGDILIVMEKIAQEVFSKHFDYGFTGITPIMNMIIDETYKYFPFLVLLVIFSIYIFVGIMFKAIFLPARLIATIGLTIFFIYGANTVLFEYDTFFNDLFPVLDTVSITFFMVPLMSFSILIGLGMDYDIFTIERIRENTWNGMENNEAIAQGLSKTGRIITGAGIIMMVAFGGLIFSSSYILKQFGFILAFGVFLDTFVVRTLLVPALMSFADKYNWYPSQPPSSKSSYEEVTTGD
ncbi:MAG: MMPL family transporter, partial [Candidatus Hodarchaeales archaeon]